jgi:hypothetical protein
VFAKPVTEIATPDESYVVRAIVIVENVDAALWPEVTDL